MNHNLSNAKNNNHSNSRPPTAIVVLLGFVFIFATIGLINDISTWKGVRPFGVISDVLAQVTGFGLNTGKLAKQLDGGGNLLESNDRCQIIDPNKAEIKTASQLSRLALPSLEGNMGGANTAIVLDGGYDSELNEKILKYASDLGMSYNLGMVTANSPTSQEAAAQFIKQTNALGMLPIIRLCAAGFCSFQDQNQIIDFYTKVHSLTSPDEYFLGVIGPNEPGSGEPALEMNGFVGGLNYDALLNETDQVAKALQGLRPSGINAGHMLLAPAIFNLTNAVNNDVKEYLYSGRIFNPEYYDYLLGNTYELSVGVSAYDFYVNGAETNGENTLKEYADGKDIPVIISEFGAFFENYQGRRQAALEEQTQSFAKFCQDGNVEGVLFFRSFLNENGSVALNDELVWKDRHGMTPSEHALIIGDCPVQKKPGFKDFSWANCNFDSCIYPKEYSTSSTASACGEELESRTFNIDNGAALKVKCENNNCTTQMIGTVEVALPIKQFGSNSSAGTSALPFTPICAEVASYYANSEVDALNQFAGILTTGVTTSSRIDNLYTGKTALSNPIAVISDSQGAPGPERGDFLPQEWFTTVNRSAAIAGSSARGFADASYPIPSDLASNTTVVIWLGTNDCPSFDLEGFKLDINNIISNLENQSIIFVPIPLRSDGLCSDSKVNSFNEFLKSLDNGSSIKYLNVSYNASNKDSFLYSDGVHIDNYKPINEGLYSLISSGTASIVNFNNIDSQLASIDLSKAYPMPWLGSAINCSAELILASQEFARLPDKASLNPGSSTLETIKELNSKDNPFGTTFWEENFSQKGGSSIYPLPWNDVSKTVQDEKALCIDSLGFCLDKGVASDIIDGLRDYLPQNTPSKYRKTTCGEDTIYLENRSNYIIGPEVQVQDKTQVWSGTGGEVCRKYANRKNEKDVLAGVDYPGQLGGVNSEQYQAAALDCQIENKSIIANGISFYCPNISYLSTFSFCTLDKIKKGECSIPAEYAECLKYNQQGGDEIYIKTDKWPNNPNYDIPGVYDSLYRMYQRLQTQMSERGLKMVFRENLAWKTEVTSKVRDANRPLSESNDRGLPDVIPNQYAQDLDSCELPSNIYNNEFLLAKTNPTRTEYQYYDWLGYLDVLQEMSVAYTKDSTFSAEKLTDNPNYGKNNAANNTRRKVLETGLASVTTSFPVVTCDQVEQWKFDENPVQNSTTDSSNQPSTQYYCPVEAGLCGKGPGVESHEGLNAVDLFNTNYNGGDQNVIAPFDGEIVEVQNADEFNYCNNGTKAGGRIFYQGKIDGKTVKLMFLHVLVDDSVQEGNTYKAGQKITRVSKLSDLDVTDPNQGGCIGIQGPHLHMEVEEGQYKNNIASFTKALGCDMQGATGLGYQDFDNFGNSCFVRSDVVLGAQGNVGASSSADLALNPEALIKPDDELTCITDMSDNRFKDELGEFLCSKGYTIEGLCDNSCKVPPEEQINGDVTKLDFGATSCPLQNDACYQGPLGGFTHYCSTTQDPRPSLSFDLYTKGAVRGNSDLYAPEAGEIVQIVAGQNNFCPNLGTKPETIRGQLKELNSKLSNGAALVEIIDNMSDEELLGMRSNGGYIIYQGKSGVKYVFLHLRITSSILSDYVTTYDKPGKFMTANGNTIRLYEVPNGLWTPCIQGTHLHTNASYNGQKINPYVLYGDVLGCGSTNSCRYDKACEAPEWTTVTDGKKTSQDTTQTSTISAKLNSECKYDENGNPIVDGDKNFSSIQCLLDEVADLIGRDYPGITGNVIRAILDVESRGEADKRPGDPTYVSYVTDNGYGTRGPMQFTQIGWDGIMRTDADLILYCVKGLGLPFNTVEDLSHDDAVILGVALCAGGTKLARDGRNYLGIPKGEVFTEEQWTQRVYDATGENGFYDITIEQLEDLLDEYPGTQSIINLRERLFNPNYKISALHIASAPYYGRHSLYGDCIWEYGGEVGDYCQLVFREYSKIVNDTNDDGVSDGTPDSKYVCSSN